MQQGHCDTCAETDRIARVDKDTQEVCSPVERVRVPTKQPQAVKQTRFPDRFNTKGKLRRPVKDKHAENKRSTTNKSKDRAQLRRIKLGFDEPFDFRISEGLTVHDVEQYSWKASFAVRNLSKLERENALRLGGSCTFTYGCACVRQAWKMDHPMLVAGTSIQNSKCIGCVIPQVRPTVVKNILDEFGEDFAHDDNFYIFR